MKHVILGNGAAAISAAEKMRQLDDSCDITIISIEDTPVYTKFMLPDYIGGKISKQRLILRDLNYYSENRINLMLSTKVENIDVNNKCINLANGIVKEYDKLLIAVGGNPFIPDIEGLKEVDYLTLNSIKDADTIIEKAVEGQRAAVVGAGLTGIETSFALKRLGMKVTMVERESRILPQQLDAVSAEYLVNQIKEEGIELLLEKNIKRVLKQGTNYIEFADGDRLEFDMIIITIGTRPNLDIIKGTNIEFNRGILVDDFMETTVKDIFAAGDVAETINKQSGYVSSYIWPNAMAQGKCAAYNMVGQRQKFSSEASVNNAVRLRDLPFVSMGLINPIEECHESLVYCDDKNSLYKKVVIKDNKVKGMIFLGDTSSANLVGDFIRKGTDVSDTKNIILDKDFVSKYKAKS